MITRIIGKQEEIDELYREAVEYRTENEALQAEVMNLKDELRACKMKLEIEQAKSKAEIERMRILSDWLQGDKETT